jgi:polyisoprenoid-binding protein YceI
VSHFLRVHCAVRALVRSVPVRVENDYETLPSAHLRAPKPLMHCLALVTIAFAAALPAQQPATDLWRIDANHSAAFFSVRHLMISTVRGQFNGINGLVHYDPKRVADATVEASIDCRTLNTGVAKRDEQMKGPDFFDTKRFPLMKFKSRKIHSVGAGKLKITGDLTINDITREVVLDVDGPSAPVRDAQGREKIGLNASTKIDRSKFHIVWNEILESGGVAVADEVSITLDIELIRGEH